MSDVYQVGYGKPPREGQFKKGQSGNPRGRPAKKKGTLDPLSALDAERQVRINGRQSVMSSSERRLRKQVQRAIKDRHVSAMIYLLKEFEKFGLLASEDQEMQNGVILAPSDIPAGMFCLLEKAYGLPPWSDEERDWARWVYLAHRTDQERKDDESIGWPCLREDQQTKERP